MKEYDEWRMLPPGDQRTGQIAGLPESRGIIRATNGILCYIDRGTLPLYLGRIGCWENDPTEVVSHRQGRRAEWDVELDEFLENVEP